MGAAADPEPPLPPSPPGRRPHACAPAPRRARKDVVLHAGAMRIIEDECRRRGSRFSETLNAMVNEWEMLRGIRRASEFRHATKNDLNAMVLNAQVIATAPPGRQRDEALNEVRTKAQTAKDRLVLVTVL